MTRACQPTSVVILSLLPRAAALFLSKARAERAAFSPLTLIAAQSAPKLTNSLDQTPAAVEIGQQDDVVVTQW